MPGKGGVVWRNEGRVKVNTKVLYSLLWKTNKILILQRDPPVQSPTELIGTSHQFSNYSIRAKMTIWVVQKWQMSSNFFQHFIWGCLTKFSLHFPCSIKCPVSEKLIHFHPKFRIWPLKMLSFLCRNKTTFQNHNKVPKTLSLISPLC